MNRLVAMVVMSVCLAGAWAACDDADELGLVGGQDAAAGTGGGAAGAGGARHDAGGGGGSAPDAAVSRDATPSADASAPGSISCGTQTCGPRSFRGLVDLPACCGGGDTCGVDLRPAAVFAPVPATCTAVASPGISDPECPDVPSPSALYSSEPLQGCCRANRTCGVFLRAGDLNLGCVDLTGVVGDGGASLPCGSDAGP